MTCRRLTPAEIDRADAAERQWWLSVDPGAHPETRSGSGDLARASITDYTLPSVRQSLAENQRLLAAHWQGCKQCCTRKLSKSAWCPDGWLLHGANRQLQAMIRRMEDIQLKDRQPSLFDVITPARSATLDGNAASRGPSPRSVHEGTNR